jgi:hypothetical protein
MSEVKVDWKKKAKMYYNPKPTPEIIEIPTMQFLMIDGKGTKAP